MTRQIGDQYAGFELVDVQEIQEIKSVAYTWTHSITKMKLVYLSNQDDNKVFLIGFRTPPGDSTGVPHIIEHSVLCGSEKFPLKDPFLELAKGSMNTFINAMTSNDHTDYPVASQNDQDFQNLMDVYMDAVLHPNMKQEKKIFQQEGWHHEILDKQEPITIQGIVYNEMKGAYSTPESILDSHLLPSLYPNTPYRYDSGGNPDHIPSLTYEAFLAFHDRYYHPSNGYIILYGNGNMEEQLSFLQDKYLQHYTYQPVDSSIPLEPAFPERRTVEFSYPVQEQNNLEDLTYFSLNLALPPVTDPKMHMAWEILSYILLESSAAPLKKALLDAGIGKDVFGGASVSLRQPVFSIHTKQASIHDQDRFISIIEETLQDFVKNGLDKKLIESSLNRFEFQLKEADFHGFPKGLAYAYYMIIDSLVYDLKPTLYLSYQPDLDSLKEALHSRFFEEMIQHYLLNNPHSVLLVGKPNLTMADEKAAKLEQEMASMKSSLSKEALQKLVEDSLALKQYQSEEDTEEIKQKIPQLSLQDIRKEALWYPEDHETRNHVQYLLHPIETNGIAYLKILFPADGLTIEQLPYVSLLADLLGELDTAKKSYGELTAEVDIYTGGIQFSADILSHAHDDTQFKPYFSLQTKFFPRYTNQALFLINEILLQTTWNQPKRIRELLQQYVSRFEMNFYWYGSRYATKRMAHFFSPSMYIQELLDGVGYYQWAKDWLSRLDHDFDNLMQELETVRNIVLSQVNRVVSVTADPSELGNLKTRIQMLNQAWQASRTEKADWQIPLEPAEEGLQTGSRVQYVAKGYNFKRLGYTYHGSQLVIDNLLSYDFLWNQIRVQGGAYGANSQISRNGNLFFSSYRDPHLQETIEVFEKTSQFLSRFQSNQRVINSYIIGALSSLDHPLTPSQQGDRAARYTLTGITKEFLDQEREQVFQTTLQEIHEFAPILEECMKMPYACVIGNEKKIEEKKELFTRFTKLMI